MARPFWTSVLFGTALAAFSAFSVQAHEFWLLPNDFTVEDGTQIEVSLRNGEKMKGIEVPYLPGTIARFELVIGNTVTPVTSRLGDTPAMSLLAPASGLAVVLHLTNPTLLTYKDFSKFQRFVAHKAMLQILDQHAARGLPETGFIEDYSRYAKSLIAIGAGEGADRAMGLRIEIVALANPYTDDLTAGMPLQVLLDGQPRVAAQLELFVTAPDGTITQIPYITDAKGQVTVPAQSGYTYLADSVDIFALPNNDATAGPVWHSDWASLTYLVP